MQKKGNTTERDRKSPDLKQAIQSVEETNDIGIASGVGGIGIASSYAVDL